MGCQEGFLDMRALKEQVEPIILTIGDVKLGRDIDFKKKYIFLYLIYRSIFSCI